MPDSIAEKRRLEKCRAYRRSAQRMPWIILPWDAPRKHRYAPWDGRLLGLRKRGGFSL